VLPPVGRTNKGLCLIGSEEMPNHYDERWDGPIMGLQLPLTAWNSLQEDGIRTMDQLRAVAHQL
jgi:hypothetical protein